jgi:quercetin dioxygenase-like cupin family protein
MKLDGKIYEVRPGDSVHIPPKAKHQLINDDDEWVEYILVSAPVA